MGIGGTDIPHPREAFEFGRTAMQRGIDVRIQCVCVREREAAPFIRHPGMESLNFIVSVGTRDYSVMLLELLKVVRNKRKERT